MLRRKKNDTSLKKLFCCIFKSCLHSNRLFLFNFSAFTLKSAAVGRLINLSDVLTSRLNDTELLHKWRLTVIGNYTSLQQQGISIKIFNTSTKMREFKAEQERLWHNYTLVKKTVFQSYPRVVFVAGLEGTGHHFLRDALEGIFCIFQT